VANEVGIKPQQYGIVCANETGISKTRASNTLEVFS
jgi:hypothetical protein